MNKAKNTFLITGIWVYMLYGVYDILFRIPYKNTISVQPLFKYIILCGVFSMVAYMVLPSVLLLLNLKNKFNRCFSVVVAIFSMLSIGLVAIKFSPVLCYLIIDEMGLLDTYWQYLFFEILPKRGVVGLICFVLITIGAIMSCKKE